ncbi:cytochrome P450 [Pisolithus albus]|nr:cytochrome P450 [Pisolithus albus]
MTSYTLSTAQVSAMLLGLGLMFITHVMHKKESTHPPKVPSLLPWLGSVFGFAFTPSKFLALCHARFGPVFKVLVGGHNIIVVGTADSIHNALFTDHRVLSARVEHYDHFRAVCDDTSLYPLIHDTINLRLFPILDRRLSKRSVDDLTVGFAETLFQRLKLHQGDRASLKRSLTEPVYVAVTAIFLGSKFSPDNYEDWLTFWDTLPIRLCRRPFWSFPSTRARGRLLQHITTCIQAANPNNDDDKLAGDFSQVIREHSIPFEAASPGVALVMLALHTNLFNNVFWLLAWLMADPPSFTTLRDDIDRAVRAEFGNLQTFIAEASPRRLDSPAFALLNSAILETTRLTTVQNGLRLAESDFQLKDGAGAIPVKKGEYVMLYPRAAQQNSASYPDGHKFVLDRFVQSQYQGELAATSGKPYFAFGAGKHLVSPPIHACQAVRHKHTPQCKGKFLAMFEMKVLIILYLSLFDVTPVPLESLSSEWKPPPISAQSIGTIHPDDDVLVRLRPRTTL